MATLGATRKAKVKRIPVRRASGPRRVGVFAQSGSPPVPATPPQAAGRPGSVSPIVVFRVTVYPVRGYRQRDEVGGR